MSALLLSMLLAVSPDGGVPFPEPTIAALRRVVLEARSVGPVDGLAVAVLHRDQLWIEASGPKISERSSFRVASITKTFTAAMVMRLVQEGRLQLDADVRTWVPEFPVKKEGVVTVGQLLSHTSGIGHYTRSNDGRTLSPTSVKQSLALFKDRLLLAPPGQTFVYSSYGYVLLGALVERVTKKPFSEHLHQTLLDPLGMRETGLEADPVTAQRRATGYRVGSRGLAAAQTLDISSRFSSGGMRSTVGDVITWGGAWLDGAVVDEASWKLMTKPALTTDGLSPDYGMGWAVYPMRGRKIIAHGGGQPGASSLLLLVPEERFAVAILSNVGGRANALTRLSNALMEVVVDEGTPRRSLTSSDPADELRFDAMSRAMSHGLVALRQAEQPSEAEVSGAFTWAAELLSDEHLAGDRALVEEEIRNGYQPKFGRRSVLWGAEVGRVLAERKFHLAQYPRRGALAFFADYVATCAEVACPHPLEPSFAVHVVRLNKAWEATPVTLRALRSEDLTSTTELVALLEPLAALPVHPDFVDDLTRQAMRERKSGRAPAARQLLELSARLHPRSALATLALAEDAALSGDRPRATLYLQQTLDLRPQFFGAEFVKDREESLRFGASAAGAAAIEALFVQAKGLAKHRALPSPTQAHPECKPPGYWDAKSKSCKPGCGIPVRWENGVQVGGCGATP